MSLSVRLQYFLGVLIWCFVLWCFDSTTQWKSVSADDIDKNVESSSSKENHFEESHTMTTSRKDLLNEWSPLDMVSGNSCTFGNYALMILNQPIKIQQTNMVSMWNKAEVRMTVDGGTNEWYKFKDKLDTESLLVQSDPDIVCGDFDSISTDILQRVRNVSGIHVVETPDVNQTDFTKAFGLVSHQKHISELDSVVVIVENSGRLDKILNNIDTLYKVESILGSRIIVFVVTKDSISWMLRPGKNIINVPSRQWNLQCWCGILPLIRPATVTTTGLKWNLDNRKLSFGDLISTSNTYGDTWNQNAGVSVTTDEMVMWTMGTCLADKMPSDNY